jgi:hypothetical protein
VRHWLWYKTTGEIGGDIITGGGWDLAVDFNEPSTDETVQGIREHFMGQADYAGFVPYDCAHPAAAVWCNDAANKVGTDVVDTNTQTLASKPVFDLILDGVAVAAYSSNDKSPGSAVTLQLQVATGSIPDGTVVKARNVTDVSLLQTSPQDLTFVAGVTNQATLTAPAQGQTGNVWLDPADASTCVSVGVKVRGWT